LPLEPLEPLDRELRLRDAALDVRGLDDPPDDRALEPERLVV